VCSFVNADVLETYDASDGMISGHVFDIYQDGNGDLWIATTEGISRFDGRRFYNFMMDEGLPDLWVKSIEKDDGGNLWFATKIGGAVRYDGIQFQIYTEGDGLTGNNVWDILRDSKGRLWFGTDKGVCYYDGSQFHQVGPPELVIGEPGRILEDRKGNLWFSTGRQSHGVFRFDGERFQQYTTEDGLMGNDVSAMLEDSQGRLWFSNGDGVSWYDGKSFHHLRSGGNEGFPFSSVMDIYQDSSGDIWFAGTGVCRYDGNQFTLYTTTDGLPMNSAWRLSQDREGNIWIGTGAAGIVRLEKNFHNLGRVESRLFSDNNGQIWGSFSKGTISRFDGTSFVLYLSEKGSLPPDAQLKYVDAQGNLWIQSSGGLLKYDGEQLHLYLSFQEIPQSASLSYVDTLGRLWFRRGREMLLYDNQSFHHILTVESRPGTPFESSQGDYWIVASPGPVYRYRNGEITRIPISEDLAKSYLYTVNEDLSGRIWVGANYGAYRSEEENSTLLNLVPEVSNVRVTEFFRDRSGVLWIATRNKGVCRYNGRDFHWFGIEDGLTSNWVNIIYEDSRGDLWFGSPDGGVTHYDGANFQRLTRKDGLPSNAIRQIIEDRQTGTMLFVTGRGIVHYTRLEDVTSPHISITRIVADKSYEPAPELQLPHTATHLILEYYGKSFRTKQMRYNYILEGYESDWHKTWDERAEYENLRPGSYTFKVIAIDRDLVYSEQPANVQITILPPPFYKSGTFIVGMILAAFLIPTAVYTSLWMHQRRKEAPFEPIPNPYIVGNPIRGKEMFFGREDDFQFVSNKLAGGQKGMVIVFCGERRSGKTSILYQIMDGRLGENFVPVLIDMQGMAVQGGAEFCEKLADAIAARVGDDINAIKYDFHAEGINPIRTFERFIDDVMASIEGKSLLLLFDEYELLEIKITQGALPSDIITFFASILERYPNLSFIFTGSRYLEQRQEEYWHRIIPKSIYRKISFLSQRDALRLITEPVKGTVSYQRQIPEMIYRLTAGQPFYTQVICQNLVDRLNGEERNRVFAHDVDAVVSDLSDNPLPQMIYFWDDLTGRQRIILALLAELLDNPDSYITVKQIADFVKEKTEGLQISESDIQTGLDELCDEEILERERAGEGRYEYRYKVDLFRHWVRRGHSIWQILADGISHTG
ncbi:MAG: two-component regulator propeller domain-containing protein, partial [Candidatus Poribacteria bacterium]